MMERMTFFCDDLPGSYAIRSDEDMEPGDRSADFATVGAVMLLFLLGLIKTA